MADEPKIFSISADSGDLGVPTFITKPEGTKYHWIEDGELSRIMHLAHPKSLLIAIACGSYILGQAQTICNAVSWIIHHFTDKSPTPLIMNLSDCFFMSLIVGCAALGITTGIYAALGESEVSKTLKNIRNRPPIQLKMDNVPR